MTEDQGGEILEQKNTGSCQTNTSSFREHTTAIANNTAQIEAIDKQIKYSEHNATIFRGEVNTTLRNISETLQDIRVNDARESERMRESIEQNNEKILMEVKRELEPVVKEIADMKLEISSINTEVIQLKKDREEERNVRKGQSRLVSVAWSIVTAIITCVQTVIATFTALGLL